MPRIGRGFPNRPIIIRSGVGAFTQTLGMVGVPSAEAVSPVAASAKITTIPTGVPSAQAVSPVTVLPKYVTAQPGILSAEAFGAITLVRGAVTASLLGAPSAEAFGLPLFRKLLRIILTAVPPLTLGANYMPDFKYWSFAGNAYYDAATGDLVLPDATSYAVSPLVSVPLAASVGWRFRFEAFGATASTNPSFAPQAGLYSGVSYYQADHITPAHNSVNAGQYSGNGWAGPVTIGAWTQEEFNYEFGGDVSAAQYVLGSDGTAYTSYPMRIRKPMLLVAVGGYPNVIPYEPLQDTLVDPVTVHATRTFGLTGVPSAEAVSPLVIYARNTIALVGVPSAQVVNAVALLKRITLALAGAPSAEAVDPVIVHPGSRTVTLVGAPSLESFGIPRYNVKQTTVVVGVPSGEVVNPIGLLKRITLLLAGVPSSEAVSPIGNFLFGSVTSHPAGIASGEAFGTIFVVKIITYVAEGVESGQLRIAPSGLITVSNAPFLGGLLVEDQPTMILTSQPLPQGGLVVLNPYDPNDSGVEV